MERSMRIEEINYSVNVIRGKYERGENNFFEEIKKSSLPFYIKKKYKILSSNYRH